LESPTTGSGRIEIIRQELGALGRQRERLRSEPCDIGGDRLLNGFPPPVADARSIGPQPDDRPGTTLELDAPWQPEHSEQPGQAVVPDARVPSRGELATAGPTTGGGWLARLVFQLGRHAWVVTAALCALVDFAGVRGVDMAAQDYRVWAFRAHGFMLWDVNWYAGHTDVGYSVLFPALGALTGAMPATALAATCSTWIFGRLVQGVGGWPSALARLWFAVFAAADVVIGRGPFACALTFGLLALLAARSKHSFVAGGSALVASLFSPLGAMFLLIVAAAWAPSLGWRRTLPFLAAGYGLLISALTGDGGFFPFPVTALLGQLAIVVIGLAVAPRSQVVVRRALLLFGLTCLVLFVLPNPVGGNVARLNAVLIGPLAAYVLFAARRTRILLALTGPMLAFQLLPVVSSVADAAVDPSTHGEYYQGVVHYLATHQDPAQRVEIPLTRNHWEATYVAEKASLARGWYRQVDIERNAVLYAPLTAATYRNWLSDNAVEYIALPDARLDGGGLEEAALLAHPPSWLHVVYHDAHWRVWRVDAPTPIATGAAFLDRMDGGSFTLTATGPGPALVRVRWSPYWHVDQGQACLAPAPGGWTEVVAAHAGTVRVTARLAVDHDQCAGG
jgi:hypothetical protein